MSAVSWWFFSLVGGTTPWLFERQDPWKETPGTVCTGFLLSALRKRVDEEADHVFIQPASSV